MSEPSVIDVAKVCGVSPSTVCRALNDKGDVSEKTRTRILETCAKLGYVRNSAASNLRRRKTNTIACVVPEGENELHIDKLHLLKAGVVQGGFDWQLWQSRDDNEMHRQFKEALSARPAGMILWGNVSADMARALRTNGVTAVTYDSPAAELDSVLLDRTAGVRQAVRYLFEKGRRRVLLVGASRECERGRGYTAAHDDFGLKVDHGLILDTPYGRDLYAYGYGLVKNCKVEFDAVMAVNDACAIGAMRALHELNRGVPQDVSVIGMDRIMVSRYTTPALTTVSQPIEDMASYALQYLFERMKNPGMERRKVLLKTELCVRESA